MKFKRLLSFFLLSPVFILSYAESPINRTDSIREALKYQISHYPSSQYRDVYKNFMQDYFGPGHLLNDTAAAGRGLRKELDITEVFEGPDYEPTGFQGNFYRVNLRLIKENIIPYDLFFETFVESVQSIQPPSPSYWMGIWNEVDNEIKQMGLSFMNEETDRRELKDQFSKDNFVVHHSDAYNEAVNFHYRIISKDKFENVILPILEKSDKLK